MPVLSTTQMTLNFEQGISAQCSSLKEFMREEALPNLWRENGVPKKHVAADMDLSPSELTRKLSHNPNDPRNFTIEDLERYLGSQGDLSPLYYLLDKYGLQDPADRRAQLLAELEEIDRSQARNQGITGVCS